MISTEFTVNKRDFLTKKHTILKEKIRTILRAYTLRDFNVDEAENTITCRMRVERMGVIKEIPKLFSIIYQPMDIPDNINDIRIKLYVTSSRIEPA